jgi:23S rRNA (adenine2503-C2)-methyltransferase
MKVIKKTSDSSLATVYVAESASGQWIEFVESTQPPFTREQKWVLVISTLFGCPVDCKFCDAGGNYKGKLSYNDLLFQVDYLIRENYPDLCVPVEKFKIQFARMGEPSFNPAVLQVLRDLPGLYHIPGFIPSLSTIAPKGTNTFFSKLLEIKKDKYPMTFQLQFSIHSTEKNQRDQLIPVRKWDFYEIARYGKNFFDPEGRKVTLNFALSTSTIIEPEALLKHFSPEYFIIKLTPINPTFKAFKNKIEVLDLNEDQFFTETVQKIREAGYEAIISIGELEENQIGSNCGQYIQAHLKECENLLEAYSYKLK